MSQQYPLRVRDEVWFPRCGRCLRWVWPPREACPACGQLGSVLAPWNGPARVVATVRVHRGVDAALLADGPYELVKVELGGAEFITRWAGDGPAPDADAPCALRWELVGARPWPVATGVGE